VVHHVRDMGEFSHPLGIRKPLVPNADDALGLLADERKCIELCDGIRSRSGRLLLKRLVIGGG
jgi:hypothetical protein